MELNAFVPAAAFALAATITPGGATTLATASGARFGFARSVPLLAGIATGLAAMAALASAGLAGALAANPSLGLAMKAVGSAYLAWLAWKTSAAGAPKPRSGLERPLGAAAGAWLLWCNPKAWAMTTSAAASFATAASGPLAAAAALGAAFGLGASVSLSLWCGAGLLLSRLLRTERQWHVVNAVLGLLLLASIASIWL